MWYGSSPLGSASFGLIDQNMCTQQVVSKWIESVWYDNKPVVYLLMPLSWLYRFVIVLRRAMYRFGACSRHRLNKPVIVVGNISVGGTGKTPLVIWIVRWVPTGSWPPEYGQDRPPPDKLCAER